MLISKPSWHRSIDRDSAHSSINSSKQRTAFYFLFPAVETTREEKKVSHYFSFCIFLLVRILVPRCYCTDNNSMISTTAAVGEGDLKKNWRANRNKNPETREAPTMYQLQATAAARENERACMYPYMPATGDMRTTKDT